MQSGLFPSRAFREMAAAGSPTRSSSASQAGSAPFSRSLKKRYAFTSPGPETRRSQLTRPWRFIR